jgi:hypothetical protein
MTMGRSSVIACILIAAIAGCRTQRQQTAPAPAARQHATFELHVEGPADTSFIVRDLFTGEQLTLDRRGELLVLRAPAGVIDTLTAPAIPELAARYVEPIDSSFIKLAMATSDTTATYTADLLCVADGELHWSARLPVRRALPSVRSPGVYETTLTLLHSPLALTVDEIFEPVPTESGAPAPWRNAFDLRFDDSTRVFYNVAVILDSVPVAGGASSVTGTHPGIALRVGTNVMIGGRWYSLSVPEDLDPDELARGTVGLVLEGKGEWGDTLRPLAVAAGR